MVYPRTEMSELLEITNSGSRVLSKKPSAQLGSLSANDVLSLCVLCREAKNILYLRIVSNSDPLAISKSI